MTSVLPVEVGSIVEGVITRITNFGVFILLPNGQTGLVHISEVADVYVRDINDFAQQHAKVRVKVLSCDERGKIALSMKQATSFARSPVSHSREKKSIQSFEDKLAKFLKDSEDKHADLRRLEGKRGGRGGRQGV